MKPSLFPVACLLLALAWAAGARAGGGPENLFLVVNASSPDSVAVANAYAALRGIPPINVLMLPWQESTEGISIATFRSDLLDPVLQAIDGLDSPPRSIASSIQATFPGGSISPRRCPRHSLRSSSLSIHPAR